MIKNPYKSIVIFNLLILLYFIYKIKVYTVLINLYKSIGYVFISLINTELSTDIVESVLGFSNY